MKRAGPVAPTRHAETCAQRPAALRGWGTGCRRAESEAVGGQGEPFGLRRSGGPSVRKPQERSAARASTPRTSVRRLVCGARRAREGA